MQSIASHVHPVHGAVGRVGLHRVVAGGHQAGLQDRPAGSHRHNVGHCQRAAMDRR